MIQIETNSEALTSDQLRGNLSAKPIKQLEKDIAQLKKLANELNPYLPLSTKHKEMLAKHNIYSQDPFIITNQLLLLLEESLLELEMRLTSRNK